MTRPRTTRSKKKPAEASGQGLRPEVMDLLLGWQSDHGRSEPMGFGAPRAEVSIEGEAPVVFAEDRHLLTIAPTGAGKGRRCRFAPGHSGWNETRRSGFGKSGAACRGAGLGDRQ